MGSPSGASTWMALMRAHQAMDHVARRSMQAVGLGYSDFTLMEALLHLGALTPSQLGAKIFLTKGSVTAAIDRLQERGLVERKNNPSDTRSFWVQLTPRGESLIVPVYATHKADLESAMNRALTSTQRRELFALLKALRDGTREEVPDHDRAEKI